MKAIYQKPTITICLMETVGICEGSIQTSTNASVDHLSNGGDEHKTQEVWIDAKKSTFNDFWDDEDW